MGFAFSQHFASQQTPHHVLLILQLLVQHPIGFIEGNIGQHGVLRIESDNLWLLFQRNVEILFDFGDVDGVINDSVSRNEPQFCREVKLQDIVVHFLGLLDVHLGQLFLGHPLVADFQVGMSGVVQPLIEEPVHGASRLFFDDLSQVVGDDTGQGVLFQISLDAFSIKVLAKLRPQHVQYPTAFG